MPKKHKNNKADNSFFDLGLLEKKIQIKKSSYSQQWGKTPRLIHLMEETGEFAEIMLHYHGYKRPKKGRYDIAVALADIVEDVVEIGRLYKVSSRDILDKVGTPD